MGWLPSKRLVGGLLLALAMGGTVWVFLQARNAQNTTDAARTRRKGKPLPVRTTYVQEGEVDLLVGGTGLTFASQEVPIVFGQSKDLSTVAPLAPLTLKSLRVHEGDVVKPGQLLCELSVQNFDKFIKQQEAALVAAQDELAYVKKQVEYNPKVRDLALASATSALDYREQDLANRQKALALFTKLRESRYTNELDYYNARSLYFAAMFARSEAERDLQRAKVAIPVGNLKDKSQVAAAVNAVETARVSLATARNELERLQVKSPVGGVVTFGGPIEPSPGQMIGINLPILRILRLDPLYVQMDLPQERIGDIGVGAPAEVVLDSFPKETFKGKFIRISPQVNAALRVVPAIIQVDNADGRLKAGISGFVRLKQRRRALTVPAAAVVQQGNKATVFRVEKGKARLREVRTGPLVRTGYIEVLGGLNAGDEVVLYQDFYRNSGELTASRAVLEDGDAVDTDWKKWTRRE
jgi:RND family efflux transporter MFP subunit